MRCDFDPGYPNNTTLKTFFNTDLIPVNKYRGNVPGKNVPLMNDLKVFRVAEMYLINAEAKVANNDLPGAALIIQQIRSARTGSPQPLPAYSSPQEAYADILQERRLELAYEGHRYIDLGRLGQRADRGIDRAQLDCTLWGGCNPPAPSDFKYRFPIPQVEQNGNPQIQQNPGYGGNQGGS